VRVVRTILISFAAGFLSAIVGWFAGYGIGILMEAQTDHSLGTGLPTIFLMYVLALVFGVAGFAASTLWHFKRRKMERH
jgi:ABC-type antimicrobial peptide transport system permease subunit